jgi:hypothetical protein
MIKIYNTHNKLLIYLVCISIEFEISSFSYIVKHLMIITQNYLN